MSFMTGMERNRAILANPTLPERLKTRLRADPGADWCEVRDDDTNVELTFKGPDDAGRMRVAIDGDLFSCATTMRRDDLRQAAMWILKTTA